MSEQRKYYGNYLGKKELADKFGIGIETLKRDLRKIEGNLPYFFSTKKTVPPIEVTIIFDHLGYTEED